jgi:hypothetical protein
VNKITATQAKELADMCDFNSPNPVEQLCRVILFAANAFFTELAKEFEFQENAKKKD